MGRNTVNHLHYKQSKRKGLGSHQLKSCTILTKMPNPPGTSGCCQRESRQQAERGILVRGTGMGMASVANKHSACMPLCARAVTKTGIEQGRNSDVKNYIA